MAEPVRLFVGLGNPGQHYEVTRHNVGQWLVDQYAHQENVTLSYEKKFYAYYGQLSIEGKACILMKPATFMNESGRAVAAIVHYFKIPTEAILVAHDELDFPPGRIRFKAGGGHGGHNGLRDTIQRLKAREFMRLRIGIGHPGDSRQVTPYVLSKPSISEKQRIQAGLDTCLTLFPALLSSNRDHAIQLLHTRT